MSPLNSFRNDLHLISNGAEELGLGVGAARLSWWNGRWSGGKRGPTCPSHPLLQPGHPPSPEGLPKCVGKAVFVAMLTLLPAETQFREWFPTDFLTEGGMLGLNIPISSVLSPWILFSLEAFCHIFGDRFTLVSSQADGPSKLSLDKFAHGWEDAGMGGVGGLGLELTRTRPVSDAVSGFLCYSRLVLRIRAVLLSACLVYLSVCLHGQRWL